MPAALEGAQVVGALLGADQPEPEGRRLPSVVRRLEDRGLVRRVPCPDPGRVTDAVLADDGRVAVVATPPGHVATVRDLVLDALEPIPLEQLGTICEHRLDRLDRLDPEHRMLRFGPG